MHGWNINLLLFHNTIMSTFISVIIPSYNAGATIETCLEAAVSSEYPDFEVIVVDDCSTDSSVEKIKKFPCRLIALDRHSGTSRARNTGALASRGNVLFFIDADCVLQKDTLSLVKKAVETHSRDTIIGGTYTPLPYDNNFFSTFQSVFVNYSETKKQEPDYIAAHAMIISSEIFKKSGGFPKKFLPIIEDVEFSHRLRKAGYKLVMCPDIQVRHIFGFNMIRSLKNAFRKSLYWTIYSLKNKDLFKDSGTASAELKTNVVACFLMMLLIGLFLSSKNIIFLAALMLTIIFNLFISRRFLNALYRAKGASFAVKAALYYITLYPLAAGAGAGAGIWKYIFGREKNILP